MTTDMRALVTVAKHGIIPTLIVACFYTVIDDVWMGITVVCVCWILALVMILLMGTDKK